MKEIIEKLKRGIIKYSQPMLYSDEMQKIIEALEEQPVKDEKCEHVIPICYNPDAFCYRSECDQSDSCIHHSNRKDKK